jgi:NADPH:quinone reductase-like Zn-dependent oxidoreductase
VIVTVMIADLAIRAAHLRQVFPLGDPAVLGFEAAGVVDEVGPGVGDVAAGDEVAVLLPALGGYAEYAAASFWVRKPPAMSWEDAAALPASGEAAVRAAGGPERVITLADPRGPQIGVALSDLVPDGVGSALEGLMGSRLVLRPLSRTVAASSYL